MPESNNLALFFGSAQAGVKAKVQSADGAGAASRLCAEARCAAGGRAMEAAAGGASDVVEAAFWWSNCLQLRWMLWAMSHSAPELELHHDDAEHPADDFEWVMQARARPHVTIPACAQTV